MLKSKPSEVKVWCVQHRDGWCATANGGRARPDHSATSDETACGFFITLRWGQEKRMPDCATCLRALRGTK